MPSRSRRNPRPRCPPSPTRDRSRSRSTLDGVGSVRVPVNCMEILDVRGDGMRTCTWNSVPRHPELTRVTLAGEPFATISITVLTR